MRATTLLSNLLPFKSTRVVGLCFEDDSLVVDVEPTTRVPRCSGCTRPCSTWYDARERRWRHLDLAGMMLELRYRLRRVDCRECGVVVEMVPWAEPGAWFTREFEQTVAYLAQQAAKTVVSMTMRIAWATVGSIVQRVIRRLGVADRLDNLTHIGVDELSYRRHHEYVTVVVDHRTGRVVWAAPGKNADTLRAFFLALGAERCAKLEAVTIDMSGAYIKAVTEASPQAQIIFDKFHVLRLAHDALDAVRRDEVRAASTPEERDALKHSRFALQKNPWNTTGIEQTKLTELQRTNKPLYRAYLLKETLSQILSEVPTWAVESKLKEWISWAVRSKLRPFVRVGRTVRRHFAGIVAYTRMRLTNARVEGLNGKARTITRRSYGLHSAHSLIAMLFLCCSGISLQPAHFVPRTH